MTPPDVSRSDLQLVLALCPAIALSDTLATAVAIGTIIVLAWCISAACTGLFEILPAAVATALRVMSVAATIGCMSLLMTAWAPELSSALGIFLPLVAGTFAILWTPTAAEANRVRRVAGAARHGLAALAVLSILGAAREMVGRGSLLHDAAWSGLPRLELFPSDLGFLLAVLPPGAFIAFGLLLAARNWLLARHRHEPDENR